MERLTGRNEYGFAYYKHCFRENECRGQINREKCAFCKHEYNFCNKLAEYEDAEEQGLLIRLPCKVGQDVFTIISQRDNFSDQPYKIVSCISFRLELINKIGKTVFLTREEAEAALERMSEDEV